MYINCGTVTGDKKKREEKKFLCACIMSHEKKKIWHEKEIVIKLFHAEPIIVNVTF